MDDGELGEHDRAERDGIPTASGAAPARVFDRASPWRIREPRSSVLTELALLTAVVTILILRAALAATNYPKVGNGTLHIAHMLWGGLLMILAFAILLQAADRVWKPFAAFMFGIGLGLFLDEIGKFITQDNDYFFKPAVAVMYVILVVFYLITRLLDRFEHQKPEYHVYFAAHAAGLAAVHRLSEVDRQSALRRLALGGGDEEIIRGLRQILLAVDTTPGRRLSLFQTWDRVRSWSLRVAGVRWLQHGVVAFFLVDGVTTLASLLGSDLSLPTSVGDWISLSWQTVAGALTVFGAICWLRRRWRLLALRMFYLATLVSILIGQVYTFADAQFFGLIGLASDLLLLVVLRLAITAIRAAGSENKSAADNPVVPNLENDPAR